MLRNKKKENFGLIRCLVLLRCSFVYSVSQNREFADILSPNRAVVSRLRYGAMWSGTATRDTDVSRVIPDAHGSTQYA